MKKQNFLEHLTLTRVTIMMQFVTMATRTMIASFCIHTLVLTNRIRFSSTFIIVDDIQLHGPKY